VLTLLAPPQVLRTLADPNHPDLAPILRAAAAAITKKKRHELRLWLEGGLFTRLLDILRGLPAQGLPPNLAAEICAAAAAAVCNVLHCAQIEGVPLPPHVTKDSLAQEAGCVEVVAAVVHCGVVNAAAAGQLPPGRGPCMVYKTIIQEARRLPGDDEYRKESFSRVFNAPRTPCIELLLTATIDAADSGPPDPQFHASLRRLLDGAIFEHMLQIALHAPLLSKPWPQHPCTTHMSAAPLLRHVLLADVLRAKHWRGVEALSVCLGNKSSAPTHAVQELLGSYIVACATFAVLCMTPGCSPHGCQELPVATPLLPC
jgi:hypothetical protein